MKSKLVDDQKSPLCGVVPPAGNPELSKEKKIPLFNPRV